MIEQVEALILKSRGFVFLKQRIGIKFLANDMVRDYKVYI